MNELILKVIAIEYAREHFDGCEPSYSTHGEGFYELYEQYTKLEEEKYNSLLAIYKELHND